MNDYCSHHCNVEGTRRCDIIDQKEFCVCRVSVSTLILNVGYHTYERNFYNTVCKRGLIELFYANHEQIHFIPKLFDSPEFILFV